MPRMADVPFLGIADNGTMTAHDIVCVHTIVGYQSGGNAAHFTTGANGKIVQARDTRYRSAANLNGNWHVIAIENEDHGPAYGAWSGSNVPRFTAAQAEAIAKILVWAHRTHNIPLTLVPDSKVGRRGIAYHRQGCDPYRVTGGELWSSAYGKVCPGDKRIAQLINEIIPRARALAAGTTMEDDDMALDDSLPPVTLADGRQHVLKVRDVLWGLAQQIPGTGATAGLTPHPVGQYVSRILAADKIKAELAGLRAAVDKLAGAFAGDDLTADELKAAVKTGVAEALAEGVVDVDINISGKGGS